MLIMKEKFCLKLLILFRAKCTVIVRLLSFLTIMLAKYKKETVAVSRRNDHKEFIHAISHTVR